MKDEDREPANRPGTPEEQRQAAELRAKLGAGDPGGPVSLDTPPPAGPSQASAIKGGFYAPPQGPAQPTLPFRPPEQPVTAPPAVAPPTGSPWSMAFLAAGQQQATAPQPVASASPPPNLAQRIRDLMASGVPQAQAIQRARAGL